MKETPTVKRSTVYLPAAAACAALLAAGCGGGSASAGKAPVTSATTSEATAPSVTIGDGEAPAPKTNLAGVVGNGQHYSFPIAVDSSHYPDECSVLPASSVQDLLGGPASSQVQDQDACVWTQNTPNPQDAYKLSFTIDNVADQAAPDFKSAQQVNSGNNPTSVAGVGQQAFVYTLGGEASPNIYVLTPTCDFNVSLIPPGPTKMTTAQAEQIVEAAAKAIAGEFS